MKPITCHDHVAVSTQGMQDHLGAKSANWLASWLSCQPRFQFPDSKQVRTLERGWDLSPVVRRMWKDCV